MTEYEYRYIKFFDDVRSNDVGLVGGKNSSLGELLSFGIPVPLTFIWNSCSPWICCNRDGLRLYIRN